MTDAAFADLTEAERSFAERAIRRKELFKKISTASVVIAVVLALVYVAERMRDPSFALAPRAVIVLLILLNARQNLRQHKYAAILEKLRGHG